MFSIKQDLTGECKKGGNSKRFVIVHHTGSSAKTTFQNIINFFKKPDYISIHYVVGREGQITQLVSEDNRAFHAGVSEWNGVKDLNNHSIGIEVLSDGVVFTEEQINATHWLIQNIIQRNNIGIDCVLRHADVARPKGRKTDVGENFFKKWGTWSVFQGSLLLKPDFSVLEKNLVEKLQIAHQALEDANNARKQLAKAKQTTYYPYEIRDTKPT